MSLEDAVLKSAEAQLALAKAMNYYADTINKYGLKVEQAGGAEPAAARTAADEKPGRKKRVVDAAPEPEIEPEIEDDDGFDEPEEESTDVLTADDIRGILLKVRDKFGDKSHAIAICNKFGYKGIPDIKEKDYAKVYAAAKSKLES